MEPYPLEELRLHLRVKLATAPRGWFIRGNSAAANDGNRDAIVDYLTEGWEEFTILRPERPRTYRSPFENIEIPKDKRGPGK